MIDNFKKTDRKHIPQPLLGSVLGLMLTYGGAEGLGLALHLYQESMEKEDGNTKHAILGTLGCVKMPDLVEKVLNLLFTDTIKDQDVSY
jgi:hypothetical protein